MRIVLLGPPGSGKGTQAAFLADALGVPAVSTGDLFRAHVDQGTELGRTGAGYPTAGDLVPDDVTMTMVVERLTQPDCSGGYVLDGFPRTRNGKIDRQALKEATDKAGSSLSELVEIGSHAERFCVKS